MSNTRTSGAGSSDNFGMFLHAHGAQEQVAYKAACADVQ